MTPFLFPSQYLHAVPSQRVVDSLELDFVCLQEIKQSTADALATHLPLWHVFTGSVGTAKRLVNAVCVRRADGRIVHEKLTVRWGEDPSALRRSGPAVIGEPTWAYPPLTVVFVEHGQTVLLTSVHTPGGSRAGKKGVDTHTPLQREVQSLADLCGVVPVAPREYGSADTVMHVVANRAAALPVALPGDGVDDWLHVAAGDFNIQKLSKRFRSGVRRSVERNGLRLEMADMPTSFNYSKGTKLAERSASKFFSLLLDEQNIQDPADAVLVTDTFRLGACVAWKGGRGAWCVGCSTRNMCRVCVSVCLCVSVSLCFVLVAVPASKLPSALRGDFSDNTTSVQVHGTAGVRGGDHLPISFAVSFR